MKDRIQNLCDDDDDEEAKIKVRAYPIEETNFVKVICMQKVNSRVVKKNINKHINEHLSEDRDVKVHTSSSEFEYILECQSVKGKWNGNNIVAIIWGSAPISTCDAGSPKIPFCPVCC